jgi:hypothetical protein
MPTTWTASVFNAARFATSVVQAAVEGSGEEKDWDFPACLRGHLLSDGPVSPELSLLLNRTANLSPGERTVVARMLGQES